MAFVDLHSHVLPALDDGAKDLSTSMEMLVALQAIGFEEVCATPHQKAAQFLATPTDIQAAFNETKDAICAARVPIALSLAAENFWDEVFFERWRNGSLPRYGAGRAFLFEVLPGELPSRFEETLFQIATRGYFPVMAHPERYTPFWRDPDRLANIGRSSALVVDLAALAGYHGWRIGRFARRLVLERIAHAAASDAHSPADVRGCQEGIAWIEKKLGTKAVTRLLDENPRRILSGELPEA